MKSQKPSVFASLEPLEHRRLLSAAIGSPLNVGDVGTYIGTARVRTSLKGAVRPTAVTLTIKTHDTKNDHITGTLQVGKLALFTVTGSLKNGGNTLSFAINKDKLGSGIFSGKVRKHLHVAEGRITLNFAKFSTAAVLDLIPKPGSTSGAGKTGTAAVPPPTIVTPPTGGTTGNPVITGGGSLFG
jgi:hypothetical protein